MAQFQWLKLVYSILPFTTWNLKYPAFSEIETILPKIEEQKQIAAYFTHLDNLITLHQRELEKLQNLKKACLEKMFV